MKTVKGQRLTPEDLIPIRSGYTISKALAPSFVLFSLSEGTDISAETYLEDKSYLVLKGEALILEHSLKAGDILTVPRNTLLGIDTTEAGVVLLEGTWEGEDEMKLEKGKVLQLKDQIDYLEGGITNLDIAKRQGMKFGLLAFDKGQGLTPHSAPGDALIIALEGEAEVTMGGVPSVLRAGDQFVFEKNIPHSVHALTQFKMAILMVVED